MSVRRPAVAGFFYPAGPSALLRSLKETFSRAGYAEIPQASESGPRSIRGAMCPHAGYVYSGHVAAAAYAKMAEDGVPDVFVLVGPNHTGLGEAISVYPEGSWETPLGRIPVDSELAAEIQESCPLARFDQLAHLKEHSLEVQLPFIQAVFGEVKIVPIAMLDQSPGAATSLGSAIASACSSLGRDCVVIASSDMSHYEPAEVAERKDKRALEAIISMDVGALYEAISALNISMCGYGPAAAMLVASRLMGAERAELLTYTHSGETTGDYSAVVGYASVVVRA